MAAGLPYRSADDRAAAEAFFEGRAASKALWHDLVREAAGWGPVEVTATKVRVCLTARTRFCYAPKAYKDGGLVLRFLLPQPLDSPRLHRVDEQGRWSHRIDLHGPGLRLDRELLGWLRAAYESDLRGVQDARPRAPRAAAKPAALWACPRCGQRFARRGQPHSCDRRAVDELFADYPKAVKVVQLVKAHLDAVSHGTVRMAATKTQVSFAARRRFAWVWVPEQAAGRGKPADPVVSFALPRRQTDGRVREAVEASPGRWMHHVLVRSGRLDARLKAWLGEAHASAGGLE